MSTPRFRLVQGRAIGERPVNQNAVPQASVSNMQENGQLNMVPAPVVSPMPMEVQQHPPVQHHIPTSSMNMMNSIPSNDHYVQQPQQQFSPMVQQQQPQHRAPMIPMARVPPMDPAQEAEDRNAVTKCVRFLKTLLNLSNNPNNSNTENANNPVAVKTLITEVIYTDLNAEEFTTRLQAALHSQAQPHLLPFLRSTIPSLRRSVRNGDVTVEGIVPPAGFVFVRQPGQQMIPTSSHMAPQGQPSSSPLVSRLISAPPQLPVSTQHNIMPPRGQPQTPQQIHQPPVPVQNLGPIHPSPLPPPSQMQPQIQPQMQPQLQSIPINQPSTSQQIELKPEEEQITSGSRALTDHGLKSSILNPQEIMNRITKLMQESCMVEEEALTLVSDAAETHLRELIAQIAGIAEHRADSMRVNENYIPIDDTKRQLRFLEDLDRQEDEVRENREKETLIRMSKNKNTGKETIEKAKEMQRADAEAKRNRDANAAAIAALSGNRTVKNKWEGGNSGSAAAQRPRTVRVTTRDLHVLVNSDNRFHGTFLREKLAYGGPVIDSAL